MEDPVAEDDCGGLTINEQSLITLPLVFVFHSTSSKHLVPQKEHEHSRELTGPA